MEQILLTQFHKKKTILKKKERKTNVKKKEKDRQRRTKKRKTNVKKPEWEQVDLTTEQQGQMQPQPLQSSSGDLYQVQPVKAV